MATPSVGRTTPPRHTGLCSLAQGLEQPWWHSAYHRLVVLQWEKLAAIFFDLLQVLVLEDPYAADFRV
jgi:hypothetical protein